MPDPFVRPARRADLEAVVRLLADDELGRTREDLGPPLPAAYGEAFDAIARDPNQLLAVLESDGEVAGCLQLSLLPGLSHRGAWRGQIESVRVDSSRRGRGLGRALILWAIDECRRRGCAIVQLTTTKSRADARRFYAGLGFAATHEGLKLDLRESSPTDRARP